MTHSTTPWKWEADGPQVEYNDALGEYCGVKAHSNRDDAFFSGERHYVGGVHCGYKWQCVEYARRYTLLRKGLVFADCGRASEIFPRLTTLTNVLTGEATPWEAVPNGSSRMPELGSVIIYPYDEEKLPWGHVGVISHLQLFEPSEATLPGRDGTGEIIGFVGIAEQNIHSISWNGRPYGRCVPLVRRPSQSTEPSSASAWLYTLEEHNPHFLDCLGWKPLPADVPDRDVETPLVPKGTFREQSNPTVFQRVDIGNYDPGLLTVEEQKSVAMQLFREHHPRKAQGGLLWTSVCFPQGGEAFVGGVHKTMRVVAVGMKHLLDTQSDEAISSQFNLSKDLVAKARLSFAAEYHNQWLARVDLSHNGVTRTVVQELGFDSLDYYIDCSLQDRVATETGNGKGFSPSSIRNDLRRSIAKLLKQASARFAPQNVSTFHFIDTSDDDQFERAQSRFIFEEAQQAFSDKADGITIAWVQADALRRVDGAFVDEANTPVRCAWKTTPWGKLSAKAAGSAQGQQRLDMLTSGSIQVHQPLWCVLPNHPRFLQLLREWVASKVLRGAGKAHKCLGDLDAEEDDTAVILGDEPGAPTGFGPYRQVYAPAADGSPLPPFNLASMLAVEGFFSATVLRESDPTLHDSSAVTPSDCYRPAAFRFYFPVNDGAE